MKLAMGTILLAMITLEALSTSASAQSNRRPTPNRAGGTATRAPTTTAPATTAPAAPAPVAQPAPAVAAATPAPAFVDIHPYQSQTIIRMLGANGEPGIIQTIPAMLTDYKIYTAGVEQPTVVKDTVVLYDKKNPLPQVERMGGNYAIYKGNYLATVSADGFFTYLGKQNYEIETFGGVYFVKKGTREIGMIDSYGMAYTNTGLMAPPIRIAGGNYFISADNTLTTFKSMGMAQNQYFGMMTTYSGFGGNPGPKYADAFSAGGNYFMNSDGSIVTISSVTGFTSTFTPDSRPAVMGGNFFIGQDDYLYTVSNEGMLFKNAKVPSRPTVTGYSFMKFRDGSFAVVDGKGVAHGSMVRVSENGKTAEVVTKMATDFEQNSTYLPNKK